MLRDFNYKIIFFCILATNRKEFLFCKFIVSIFLGSISEIRSNLDIFGQFIAS